jgi:hypothetical protein
MLPKKICSVVDKSSISRHSREFIYWHEVALRISPLHGSRIWQVTTVHHSFSALTQDARNSTDLLILKFSTSKFPLVSG